MEITFKNITSSYEALNLKDISIKLESDRIIGFYGKESYLLFDILCQKEKYKGSILLDDVKYTVKNRVGVIKKIYFVPTDILNYSSWTTVRYLTTIIENYHLSFKNREKKLKDVCRIVGLNDDDLFKEISILSKSEQKLLSYAAMLLLNPEVVIVIEPFQYLDALLSKKISKLFKLLKENHHKTILFYSQNTDLLYTETDECYLFNDGICLKSGQSSKVFQDVKFLEEHSIPLPKLVHFTYYAKKIKGIKLFYHRDIKDLIKDIYKHIDFKS
ncbi:MAG: hypothetical protein RSE91_00685 [Bacilli bacterium]